MPLPDVGAITDISQGAAGGIANQMAQIRLAKIQMENKLAAVDSVMDGLSQLPQLPNVPTVNDILQQSAVVLQAGSAKVRPIS